MSYHSMKGFPWKDQWEASNAAIKQAKQDAEEGTLRRLVYGGPAAPWANAFSDNLAKVGIRTEAVALCEITNFETIYAEVYNAVTVSQLVPWVCVGDRCLSKSSVMSFISHGSPESFSGFEEWAEEYSIVQRSASDV